MCRFIGKAISDKQDVLNLILSNLAYAVTGEDDTLEMYAIEKQLKTLSGIMDETLALLATSPVVRTKSLHCSKYIKKSNIKVFVIAFSMRLD